MLSSGCSGYMRAAVYERTGRANDVLSIRELPIPSAGPGEVFVRVKCSGVNPSDCKRRQGLRGPLDGDVIVPHNDGAGIIEAVGAGVDSGRIGERVWLCNAQRGGRTMGTAAEFIALPATDALPLPASTSFEEGACLGVPAITAHASLFWSGSLRGQRVLVTGGAGCVGYYAAQFAHLAGASYLAVTVRSQRKRELVAEVRPNLVVNAREAFPDQLLLDEVTGYDIVSEVDFLGNLGVVVKVVSRGASIGTYGSQGAANVDFPFLPFLANNVTIRFFQTSLLSAAERTLARDDIQKWLRSGLIRHRIDRVVPFEDIAAAHELVESGSAMGNVVVSLSH